MNCAYTTLVTDKNYVIGAIALFIRLQIVKSKYPLIVLTTEALKSAFDDLNIKTVVIPDLSYTTPKAVEKDYGCFKGMVNKFFSFLLLDYNKICYLDSDIFICQNCDFIFDKFEFNDILLFPRDTEKTAGLAKLPCGELFLLKPSVSSFLYNLLDINDKKIFTDEMSMVKRHANEIIDNYFLTELEKNNILYHDYGPTKYWEILINTNLQILLTSEDIDFIRMFFTIYLKDKRANLK